MHLITVIHDPAGMTKRDTYNVDETVFLSDWLLSQYGPDGFPLPTMVFMGSLSENGLIDLDNFEAVNVPINGPVFVLHRPQGLDPVTALVYIGIALITAVAITLLMPIPDLGGLGRQQKRSSNNALSGQTNVARLLDRVPEVFGQVRSYPDLIAPTVSEYINHVKYQTEYLCVGRGFFDLVDFKSGNTLISDIPGSSAAIYESGTAPAEVLKTRQSNEVSGQELVPPNEVAESFLDTSFTVAYVSGTDKATITDPAGLAWSGFEAEDVLNASDLYAVTGVTGYLLDGTYVVDTVSATQIVLLDAATENANWINFDAVTENVLVITDGDALEPLISISGRVSVQGPFVIPGNNNNEIWLDITAPKGLARGEKLNKTLSVALKFTFEEIDDLNVPTGPSFIKNITVSDSSRDPRFWTYKVGVADGLVEGQRYQVTGERLTDSQPSSLTRLEDIRWSRLAGIENISAPDTTGTTRVVIETQATQQVAALQERKFNVTATRKTVTWDGSQVVGNRWTGEGLIASRRMADAFLHYFLDEKLAARPLSSLDVEGLYAVQSKLDKTFDGEKGEFSFTFDGKDTPALEELRQIAQAARCFVYREGSFFSVTRDEAQPVARALFNRRNKLPDSETKSVRFNRPLDHDGVSLEYHDLDDNPRTITFPDDLPVDDPHYNLPATINPLKVDGVGIRQYTQAWDRAQYEFRKQIYQRVSVQSSVTADGLLAPLNARVMHVDGTRLVDKVSDGEVTAVDGLTVSTSQRCIFLPGETYSVVLRNPEGTPIYPIAVVPLENTEYGFRLTRIPGFTVVVRGDYDYQRGTLYSFGPDGDDLASAYLIQRRTPGADGNVQLELINYSDEYYAADDVEPPPRPVL